MLRRFLKTVDTIQALAVQHEVEILGIENIKDVHNTVDQELIQDIVSKTVAMTRSKYS